jgi:hypothetical protein
MNLSIVDFHGEGDRQHRKDDIDDAMVKYHEHYTRDGDLRHNKHAQTQKNVAGEITEYKPTQKAEIVHKCCRLLHPPNGSTKAIRWTRTAITEYSALVASQGD